MMAPIRDGERLMGRRTFQRWVSNAWPRFPIDRILVNNLL